MISRRAGDRIYPETHLVEVKSSTAMKKKKIKQQHSEPLFDQFCSNWVTAYKDRVAHLSRDVIHQMAMFPSRAGG